MINAYLGFIIANSFISGIMLAYAVDKGIPSFGFGICGMLVIFYYLRKIERDCLKFWYLTKIPNHNDILGTGKVQINEINALLNDCASFQIGVLYAKENGLFVLRKREKSLGDIEISRCDIAFLEKMSEDDYRKRTFESMEYTFFVV